MEALNLLKFWTPIFTFTTFTSINLSNLIDEEEEEDSFFELELTVPDLDTKKNNPANVICKSDLKASKPTVSMSLRDHFSKRRIIPIEPNFKPQSPISLLKSTPRFRVLWFKKSKTDKTEEAEFNRENTDSQNQIFPGDSSKRFSKDVIGKYLKLIKPLHVKISKRMGKKMRFSGELSSVSSRKEKQGNIPAGIRVSCKHLGKSKSASAGIGVTSPARRDDSLLLQHDGIQSAILHCKRSFNSSDSSWLSMDSPRNSNGDANGIGI